MEIQRIAILDMDSIAYTIGNANKILDNDGIPKRTEDGSKFLYTPKNEKELSQSADELISMILKQGEFTHYIGYIKGKNTILTRKNINPEYKSNRNLEQPSWWNFVKHYLILNWNIYSIDDMEVDDICNILRIKIPNSHLVCIDKDLLHLESINPHYNWRKNQWITVSKQEAEYYFWSDMICGQPGDGIKGLKGRGIKFVEKYLDANSESHLCGQVLDLYVSDLKEEKGIQEFYSNYKCLKLLSEFNGFIIPEVNLIKKEEW